MRKYTQVAATFNLQNKNPSVGFVNGSGGARRELIEDLPKKAEPRVRVAVIQGTAQVLNHFDKKSRVLLFTDNPLAAELLQIIESNGTDLLRWCRQHHCQVTTKAAHDLLDAVARHRSVNVEHASIEAHEGLMRAAEAAYKGKVRNIHHGHGNGAANGHDIFDEEERHGASLNLRQVS